MGCLPRGMPALCAAVGLTRSSCCRQVRPILHAVPIFGQQPPIQHVREAGDLNAHLGGTLLSVSSYSNDYHY